MLVNFINEKRAKKYIDDISKSLISAENTLKLSSKNVEVSITFVSRLEIKKMNRETRGINKVTDVLSYPTLLTEGCGIIDKKISKKAYPYDINPETGNIVLGDILICVPRCVQQSRKYGTTKTREICYLSVHGLLHLLGYDHMADEDKKVMRAKEEEILQTINIK